MPNSKHKMWVHLLIELFFLAVLATSATLANVEIIMDDIGLQCDVNAKHNKGYTSLYRAMSNEKPGVACHLYKRKFFRLHIIPCHKRDINAPL